MRADLDGDSNEEILVFALGVCAKRHLPCKYCWAGKGEWWRTFSTCPNL